MRFILITSYCLLQATIIIAQHHKYIAPSDTLFRQNISKWQGMKFGLFIHWGTYSQWGIVESWSLCPDLQTTFNPVRFAPEKWVQAAKDAGMRYMIFTTKHHDGFNMFDTKETDYKITDKKTPFSAHPRNNVTKEIFNAFRKEGFSIGAYFSKPDWHSDNYWWPYFPPRDRNVNYEVKKYPERWKAFKEFTYNQIKELMSQYGKVDILWLDGGWVRPLSTVDTTVEWQKGIKIDQDIDMKRIAAMARSYQPGILVVDRTVTGEYENYTTPEQEVPNEPLPFPWETCMTMGDSWSFVPNDNYKSAHKLVQLLVKIISRGGNFLLNIGPGPEGDWDPVAYHRLQDIGKWMAVNGEGIYHSKPVVPYSTDNIYYTQSKDGNILYAFYLSETDAVTLPGQVILKNIVAGKGSKISLLGATAKLKWKTEGNNTVIAVPSSVAAKVTSQYVVTFKIQKGYQKKR